MSDHVQRGAAPEVDAVDEKLPGGRLFTLGLQHVLVMYAGAITVPLIIGIACVLLGVYALFAPGASTALMMRIAGIMLAFSGVVNMIAAFALTKQ